MGWVQLVASAQAYSTGTRGRLSVGIVLLPNFTLTAFAGFVDMLRLSADEGDRSRPKACTWTVLGAELRRPIRASCGVEFVPQAVFGDPSRFDYLVPVADRLWIQDGRVATCAGGLAATDLAAALVKKHIGDAAAQKSLHILLSDGPRMAGAAQPQPPNTVRVADARVRRAMLLLEQNLSAPLPVDRLAAAVAISTRQLQRLFRRELGASLQTFGRDLRVYYAAWLMTHAPGRLSDVAARCGFSDAVHFSRTFRAAFGRSPVVAQRLGPEAMRQMVERWWPYGVARNPRSGPPVAGPVASPGPGPAGADRRPYA